MTSVTQSSHYVDFSNTIWQKVDVPGARVEGQSLADTLTIPFEEKPLRQLSDDQTEASNVLSCMLMDGIPQMIVHSIIRLNPHDILVPSNISTAPYIAISYADDTEERNSTFINDMRPPQNSKFLTIPSPGVAAANREGDNESKFCSNTVTDDLGAYLCVLDDFDEFDNLELTIDLERYLSECDDEFETIKPLEKSPAKSSLRVGSKALGGHIKLEDQELETDEEADSSLKLYGSDTESEFTGFSDSE